MGELILNVLPYGLAAAAAAPIVAVVTALILAHSERPLLSAWVFTAGAAAGGLRGMLVTGVVAQVINVDAMTVFTGAIKTSQRSKLGSRWRSRSQ
jgi:hypothetical protein